MTEFSDPDAAISVRDFVEGVAEYVIDSKQTFRRAYVVSIAGDRKSIVVNFVDEPGVNISISVGSIVPAGPGQMVEVEIRDGIDYSISKVFGSGLLYQPIPDADTGPKNFSVYSITQGTVDLRWDPSPGADDYEIWASTSSTFTSVRVIGVSGSTYTDSGLSSGSTWWYKVRARNATGSSPFTQAQSTVVARNAAPTDGAPPPNSPPVTVAPGIGMLTATWPAQVNSDPVTYDVHISTVSGFTPTTSTLLGQTSGTFWVTVVDGSDVRLQKNVTYYIRVIAWDEDGYSVPGAQGSGVTGSVDLSDAGGTVSSDQITSDGIVPTVPGTPSISSGIGYLYATWGASSSVDDVSYEVHVSTVSGFTADANTYVATTNGRFAFVRTVNQGGGVMASLSYGVTYYVLLRPFDRDGYGQQSAQGSGFTVRVNTADITVGAITAASGIIADAAIGTAKIQDAAIITAKIGDLQVGRAKIAIAAIGTAQIEDLAVSNAKIQNLQASKISSDVVNATLTVSGRILTSSATQRIEINGNGIYGIDPNNNYSFYVENSGNAYFKGYLHALNAQFDGSINVTGNVSGGTFNGGAFYGVHAECRYFTTQPANNMRYVLISGDGFLVTTDGGHSTAANITHWNYNFQIHNGISQINFDRPNQRVYIATPVYLLGHTNGQIWVQMDGNGVHYSKVVNLNAGATMYGQTIALENHSHGTQAHDHDYTNRYIANGHLIDYPIWLRGYGDNNHRLQYGGGYGDGPQLIGYQHFGVTLIAYNSGVNAMRLDSGANLRVGGSGLFNQSSMRYKKNVNVLERTKARTVIEQAEIIEFERIDERGHLGPNSRYVGFSAEQLAGIAPELVVMDDDGQPDAVNYAGMTPYLVEECRALRAEIAELRALLPGNPN